MDNTSLAIAHLHFADYKSMQSVCSFPYRPQDLSLINIQVTAAPIFCLSSLLFSSSCVHRLPTSPSQLTSNDLCPFLSTFYKRHYWEYKHSSQPSNLPLFLSFYSDTVQSFHTQCHRHCSPPAAPGVRQQQLTNPIVPFLDQAKPPTPRLVAARREIAIAISSRHDRKAR